MTSSAAAAASACGRRMAAAAPTLPSMTSTRSSSSSSVTRLVVAAWFAMLLQSLVLIPQVLAQSNYAVHANNVAYQGEGLPEEATLDGKVTKLDDLSPIIFLNRTKAALNCAAGSMEVEMKFNEPFFGLAYADFDRNSACQLIGKGELNYKLELPLKGCGTRQEPQRVFTNNIVVRFHPGLEMDGDEIVTIVCRYPPPLAPPPAGLPAPILNPIVPASLEPPLRGIQMLFIICGIVFMTLLLLGLGVSYHCLRRRTIPVVRRLPMSMGSGSEITRLSGSSLGNISHFEGLKIPRAHAPLATVHSLSGSDGPLVSDTLPSDYPSESHSEADDIDTRSLPVSSAGSFENRAFVLDTSSIYSEHYGHTQEFQAGNAVAAAAMTARHPIAVREPSPKFDVQVRVKRAPPPPPMSSSASSGSSASASSSDTDSVATVARDRNNLSTIMESHEDRESVVTIDSMPAHADVARSHFTYVPELHQAPQRHSPAPVHQFTQSVRHQQSTFERHHETVDHELWPEDYADGPVHRRTAPHDGRSVVSHGTERTDSYSVAEMTDYPHRYADERYQTSVQIERPEPPIVVARRTPEVTQHVVDDVFLRTITEKKTIEDVERYKQLVTEYKARSPSAQSPTSPSSAVVVTAVVPDPTWDVTIRNYPGSGSDDGDTAGRPQWENFSDISSVASVAVPQPLERTRAMSVPPPQFINESGKRLTSPELVGNMKPVEIPPEDKAVPNWDVLIRVLEQQDDREVEETLAPLTAPGAVASVSPASSPPTMADNTPSPTYALQRQLSYDDRVKWKEIITTESSLRSMLTEAVVREDFERIRSDVRYERIFEPQTWEVLIRILAPPDDVEMRTPRGGRTKKKEPWDTRSRRSSLPTLYEYDSDGGSSVRTITNADLHADLPVSQRGSVTFQPGLAPSRRTSRSSYRSDNVDMRSMTEVMVDFARPEHLDNVSDASSVYPNRYYDDEPYERRSMHRTLSQPSLARSASEFTERWIVPQHQQHQHQHHADDNGSSPDVTPRPVRSVRVMSVQPPPPQQLLRSATTAPSSQNASHSVEQNSSSYQTTTTTTASSSSTAADGADGSTVTRRDWYSYAKKK